MFVNYLKIIFRNFRRERLHSSLNLLGLVIGLTAFILITLFIRTELSYDQFHSQKDRLYRMIQLDLKSDSRRGVAPPDLAEQLSAEVPGIRGFARLKTEEQRNLVQYEDKGLYTEGFFYTDADFFDIFDFQMVSGGKYALDKPGFAVITESLAAKVFGDENPIGKQIILNKEKTFEISGVCQDPPANSTIQFKLLARGSEEQFKNTINEGYLRSVISYLLLENNTEPEELLSRVNSSTSLDAYKAFFPDVAFELLPITDERLNSKLEYDIFDGADMRMVYLFSGIGLTILLLAIINYVNMVIARSMRRAKEIGLRKVIGAQKRDLVIFQLLESVLMTTISMLLAFAIAERIIPQLNDRFNMTLQLDYWSTDFLIILPLLGIGLGLLGGLYPAWYINKFNALLLLKSTGKGIGGKNWLRKLLVGFQFTVAGIMLLVTIMMQSQMSYMKNRDIGFKKELLVQIPLFEDLKSTSQTFKNEVLSMGGISSATVANWSMGRYTSTSRFTEEVDRDSRERPPYTRVTVLNGDADIIKTLGVDVLALEQGFDLSKMDTTHVAVSRAVVESLGWGDSAIGRDLYSYGGDKRRVVAVIEDFHSTSYKEDIQPTVVEVGKIWSNENLLVRFDAEDHQATIKEIGKQYELLLNRPFEFAYLDDEIDKFYRKEAGQVSLFNTFATIAISLSLMGLIAMASYATGQRQKEVSVRKVLGASLRELLMLLNREQTWLTLIAFAVAIPVAIYAMQDWLSTFKYRIGIEPWLFVLAVIGFILLNVVTTLAYTLKVSKANPADTLRNE